MTAMSAMSAKALVEAVELGRGRSLSGIGTTAGTGAAAGVVSVAGAVGVAEMAEMTGLAGMAGVAGVAAAAGPGTLAGRLAVALGSRGGLPVAQVVGELDAEGADALARLADDLVTQGETRLALDLRQLYSVDAAGVLALRDVAARLARCGGWLALVAVRPRVRYFLARTGMTGQFTTFASIEDFLRQHLGDGSVASPVAHSGHSAHTTHGPHSSHLTQTA